MFKRYILFHTDQGSGSGGDGGGDGGSGTSTEQSQADNQRGQESSGGGSSESVADLRREAARYRTERNELQERLKKIEDAQKTELERAQETLAEQQKESAEKDIVIRNMRVRVLAPQAGITDPRAAADAASLLDWDAIKDPSDEEKVVKALKALLEDRPYLASAGTRGGADGGEGGKRDAGSGDMNRLIREAAGRE